MHRESRLGIRRKKDIHLVRVPGLVDLLSQDTIPSASISHGSLHHLGISTNHLFFNHGLHEKWQLLAKPFFFPPCQPRKNSRQFLFFFSRSASQLAKQLTRDFACRRRPRTVEATNCSRYLPRYPYIHVLRSRFVSRPL